MRVQMDSRLSFMLRKSIPDQEKQCAPSKGAPPWRRGLSTATPADSSYRRHRALNGWRRLGYALSDRADELVREAARDGRPMQRRRHRASRTHADNGARWVTGQLGVGIALALLYLAAAALGWVPVP